MWQGCCLPFISRIYSRRSYMGRCSLPISPRRPFVPLPPCASNKTQQNQGDRLSPARGAMLADTRIIRGCALGCNAHGFRRLVSTAFYSLGGGSRECDKRQETGRGRGGSAIKSPTNDKQISHSGSPIYKCRNALPHM